MLLERNQWYFFNRIVNECFEHRMTEMDLKIKQVNDKNTTLNQRNIENSLLINDHNIKESTLNYIIEKNRDNYLIKTIENNILASSFYNLKQPHSYRHLLLEKFLTKVSHFVNQQIRTNLYKGFKRILFKVLNNKVNSYQIDESILIKENQVVKTELDIEFDNFSNQYSLLKIKEHA